MMVVAPESVIGLPQSAVDALIKPVSQGVADSERWLAWVIWSHLTEPGDMLAGQLVQSWGPKAALQAVRAGDIALLTSVITESTGEEDFALRNTEIAAELGEAIKRWCARDNNLAAVRSLEHWARLGGQVVTPDDHDWPSGLSHLGAGSPHALWLRGNRSALDLLDQAVSIVGSRNVTSYGQYCAQSIAEDLVQADYLVVSGGAYGVDAEAHRGALAAQGVTIAVLAGGADRLYPTGNSALLQEIMNSGCVLAEQPPGNAPTRWRFLQRNRLIAALGQVTVIVEMALRSGAKNTMHHALAMSRDVFAVPGPIHAQTSRGCNIAIAEGKARIVTSVGELLNELRGVAYSFGTEHELSALQQRVLDALHARSISVERVAVKAGTTTRETMQALGELEALGKAKASRVGWSKPHERANSLEP